MRSASWRQAVVAAFALGFSVSAAAADELTVFVKAAPSAVPSVEEEKARQAELASLRLQQKDLTESLKKQYGKKEEQWPAEKKAELEALFEKITLQAFQLRHATRAASTEKDRTDDAKGLDATAKGVREKLNPKKGVRAVATAEEADLQVEVLGRGLSRDVLDQMVAVIGFRVVPGGRLDPALLAKNPVSWPYHGSMMSGSGTAPIHQYSEAEPYWWIESERPTNALFGGSVYGKMESQLGDSLAKLLKEQGQVIAASRKAR